MIAHTTPAVSDYKKSKAFYTKVLPTFLTRSSATSLVLV
jgi:catechol 2,3-dioxygenase-like lactoylglutathione lyase family enzyme